MTSYRDGLGGADGHADAGLYPAVAPAVSPDTSLDTSPAMTHPTETALELAARARDSLDRCALRAQLRGDPMIGTAFPAARVLLVEQPGPWGRGGLRESRFDSSVAAELEATMGRRGVRVLTIRRPGRTPGERRRRWAIADCRQGRERMVWGDFDADAELLRLDPDAVDGMLGTGTLDTSAVDTSPSFFACAHSKHDTCCALRGRPMAAGLAEVRPGRAWECSHLGGERFAANVLVLPLGQLYGRVLPFAAAEFAAAADAGEVVPALLRGRIGLPPAAQAGLAFAHSQLAISRAADIAVRAMRTVDGGEAEVTVATPHGLMIVTVEIEQRPAHRLTCTALQSAPYLAYRAVRIVPAPFIAA